MDLIDNKNKDQFPFSTCAQVKQTEIAKLLSRKGRSKENALQKFKYFRGKSELQIGTECILPQSAQAEIKKSMMGHKLS